MGKRKSYDLLSSSPDDEEDPSSGNVNSFPPEEPSSHSAASKNCARNEGEDLSQLSFSSGMAPPKRTFSIRKFNIFGGNAASQKTPKKRKGNKIVAGAALGEDYPEIDKPGRSPTKSSSGHCSMGSRKTTTTPSFRARKRQQRTSRGVNSSSTSGTAASASRNRRTAVPQEVPPRNSNHHHTTTPIAASFPVVDSDVDSDDTMEVPYAMNLGIEGERPMTGYRLDSGPKEPMRPGDVIVYNHPLYVAGTAMAYRKTTVIATNPDEEIQLELENGDILPGDTRVKRAFTYHKGKIYSHPGYPRDIETFKMKKARLKGATDAFWEQVRKVGALFEETREELQEIPQNLVQGDDTADSDHSSSDESSPPHDPERNSGGIEKAATSCLPTTENQSTSRLTITARKRSNLFGSAKETDDVDAPLPEKAVEKESMTEKRSVAERLLESDSDESEVLLRTSSSRKKRQVLLDSSQETTSRNLSQQYSKDQSDSESGLGNLLPSFAQMDSHKRKKTSKSRGEGKENNVRILDTSEDESVFLVQNKRVQVPRTQACRKKTQDDSSSLDTNSFRDRSSFRPSQLEDDMPQDNSDESSEDDLRGRHEFASLSSSIEEFSQASHEKPRFSLQQKVSARKTQRFSTSTLDFVSTCRPEKLL